MWNPGSINVLLTFLLFGSGKFPGILAVSANAIESGVIDKCDVSGFKDWFQVGPYCVQYYNTTANFTDAEFNCMKNVSGGHLASVHNKEENDIMLSIVKALNPNDLRFWLGGFQLFKTGTFRWLDGSPWGYTNWATGEPNHISTGEECVEMNWKEDGKWNDDSCYVGKKYICAFKREAIVEEDPE